jgi:photosystem II stability/assembly factor-like uncharacterized protein
MTQDFTICVGTVGAGLWYSSDSGERWERSKMELPFFNRANDIQVRTLAVSPHNPHTIFAGSEVGLYRSDDNGINFTLVESPMRGMQIWSIALDPADPDIILVGTKPPAVFRSTDGGKRWEKLSISISEECPIGPPRVTNLVIDPRDHRNVWAGVELGGVFRSRDGGDNWTHLLQLGARDSSTDVHGVAVSAGRTSKIHVTTPDGIFTSADDGATWTLHAFPKFGERDHVSYCRGVAVKADDPDVIFVANGNDVPGDRGVVQRSKDGGQTWSAARMDVEPNSTMYWFATNRADPNLILANSIYGYIYLSRDGGDSWTKLRRELNEIRGLAWLPN